VNSPSAVRGLNPDRMRRLDRWLGIPICFALTLVFRLASLFSSIAGGSSSGGSSGASANPRKVLFIELAEMGTTVLACPAVHRLRTAHRDCQVFFLLFKQIEDSVKVLKIVPDAHVLTIDPSSLGTLIRDTLKFMSTARRLGIDTAINLEAFTRFSAILAYLSGAPTNVGFHRFTQEGLYTGDLLTHKVSYNSHLHTWQSLMTLVMALERPSDELNEVPLGKFAAPGASEYVVPKVRIDAAARQRVQALVTHDRPAAAGKRLILVNPNASKLISIRKWPLDRYAELVRRLLEDPQNACAITGVASEWEDAKFIADRVNSDRLINLTGKTTLEELIGVFNIADLLVTNDSGPAHFAALTDIDVIVFFGPETPALYKPLTDRATVLYAGFACSPCVSAFNQRRSVCTNNRCLQDISVETVHATVLEKLARRAR
jgi:ADP-heptose:LPS heptosyltransferase